MDFVKKQNVQKSSMTDAAKKMDKTNEDMRSSENPESSLNDKKAPATGKGPFHDQNVY